MNEKLLKLGERLPWLGRAQATQQRVKEVNGSFVAAGITLSIFVSIIPLLLVGIAVVGFLASGDEGWAIRFVDDLGLEGAARDTVVSAVDNATDSRRTASVVGLLGLLWTGSGVGVALQRGVRAPWQEPAEGIKDRIRAVVWLATAGIGFAAVVALGGALNWLPDAIPPVVGWVGAIAVGLIAELGLFLWMFRGLGSSRVPIRALLPGAILGAIGFEVLKILGTVYVPRLVASSSSLYGPLGIVFAILAWLMIFSRLLVYASALNAVGYEAASGTRTVPIHVPNLPDTVIVAADRGGMVITEDRTEPGLVVPEDPRPTG